jgi:ACS family hexuronate transporter-like MFS transporter
MLLLATVISYLDRQALSVNAPVIRAHLGLSNIPYSYLVTSFLVAYTIGQTLAGWLVDRLGTRLAFSLCMIWWSMAGMLHAAARSLGEFAVYRFLLGLGEAGSVPASIRGISEWFLARERSLATGVFAAGTATGVLISPPLVAR